MTGDQMERAGRFVLGLLEGDERAGFVAAMAADPALADAVARLQRHLHTLDDTARPLPANPALWSAIEAELDTAEPAVVLPMPSRPRHNLGWLPMAASVVVALGIGYLAGTSTSTTRQPAMIAVLMNQTDATPGAIVEAFADNSVRLVSLETFAVPEGRILQVWTLPDPATGPVSLGTFADPATIRLAGASLPSPHDGQLYEITLEPAPGSPTGRPTGPILVKGFAKAPL